MPRLQASSGLLRSPQGKLLRDIQKPSGNAGGSFLFFVFNLNGHAVDFHILIGADQDVLHTADDPGLDQIRPIRGHLDGNVGGLDFETTVVDDIFRMQVRLKTEGRIIVDAELGNMLFGNAAFLQHLLHIVLCDHQRISDLCFLVHLNALAQLIVDRLEIELKGTENGFQMLPKKDRPEVPMLTVNSTNDRILVKDGTIRIILTDAKIGAMAAMNTVERRQRAIMFMDSLARMYPEVPRDSLMRHALRQRQARELPEWLKEEDFRKQDIDIKLDETLSKYFREWDMNGKIDVRTGMVMTPYFPTRNILKGFQASFDNNRIGIDSAKVRAQCQVTGGLDAGEHSFLRCGSYNFAHIGHIPSLK